MIVRVVIEIVAVMAIIVTRIMVIVRMIPIIMMELRWQEAGSTPGSGVDLGSRFG